MSTSDGQGPLNTVDTTSQGILAIWNNCLPGSEHVYEDWYQREHLPERLAIPGFVRGRRYQAVDADKQYFTCYELESAKILTSEAYLERLNNPTELTTRIMSGILTGISRTACRRTAVAGGMRGAVAVTVQLKEAPSADAIQMLLPTLSAHVGVARAECWVSAEPTDATPTAEEKLRGKDGKIAACLLVELLREQDSKSVTDQITDSLADSIVDAGVYGLMCELVN